MQGVIAEYPSEESAEQAVRALERQGISIQNVVVADLRHPHWRKLHPPPGQDRFAETNAYVVVMVGSAGDIERMRALWSRAFPAPARSPSSALLGQQRVVARGGTALSMRHAQSMANNTHSLGVGYLLWIFGFTGAHRFYFGKPITGTIWFFSFGLLGVGWLIDAFLMPGLERRAEARYAAGDYDYTVAWLLLTFLGVFGLHRFYLGKWITGLVYLLSGGLAGLGYLYDYWTLNGQVSDKNAV